MTESSEPSIPGGVPHGLYYVPRDACAAYLMSDVSTPDLDPVESAVLRSLFGAALNALATRVNERHSHSSSAASPFLRANLPNILGASVGIYYVTVDGSAVHCLTGPEVPGLFDPDLTIAFALVAHVRDVYKKRLSV